MINKLKPKSEFSRNVLTLMTGTTIAQAIPIAISPILTRLYTPEDFGVFALYMSIISMVGVIVTGKYELAIMLPKNKKDALNIFFLSIILTFFISLLIFIIVLIFNEHIVCLLNNNEIAKWLYLAPFSILLIGLYNSFNYWFNRNKNYKLLSMAKATQSFTTSGSNLTFGFFNFNNIGLIISNFISQFIIILFFIKKFDFKNIRFFNKNKMIIFAKKYDKFPKITMCHHLLNNLSTNIPVILLAKYFSSNETGLFMFSNRIIGTPISIISGSISDVFFRELSYKMQNDKNNLLKFFKNMVFKLTFMLFPIFLILLLFLPKMVIFVFGEKWVTLGSYLQILLPMFFFRSIGSVLSHTIVVFEKQFEGFLFEILSILLRVFSIIVGGIFHNVLLALILFSINSSLLTVYRIFWYKNIIKEYVNNDL